MTKDFLRLLPDEIVANLFLCADEQNKSIFKFPIDRSNFCNANLHFSAWKFQRSLVVLNAVYSKKFYTSIKFRERVSKTIKYPLQQLEIQNPFKFSFPTSLTEQHFEGIGRIVLNGCTINKFPADLTYLSLKHCRISCDIFPILKRIDCHSCIHSENRRIISVLNILEEASFKCMRLVNYHTLAHLKYSKYFLL
jgi:hypothetical protein